jgi:hypothetical protein
MAILLGNEVSVLDNTGQVNAFSASAQAVYTAPVGKKVMITSLTLRCIAASGVTAPCTAKVEVNPAAGDIYEDEVLIGVDAVDDTWTFTSEARGIVVPAGGQVDVTVTNPATGTSQTLVAEVVGYVIFF